MEVKDVKKLMPQGYRYIDLAARDASACSKNFKELKPTVKDFSYPPNYAQRDRLLSLSGTIPVNIRGSTYNIPVCIYLRKDHPYYPPYCFVVPATGMSLSPSRYMDQRGMVYLPYLSEWKQDKSRLSDLVQVLIVTFGEQCPVYSTPQNVPQPRQWNQPVQPPPGGYPQQQQHAPYPQQPYGAYPRSQPPTGAPYPTSTTPVSFPMPTATPSYPQQYSTPYPAPAGAAPYPTGSSPATQFSQQPPYQPTPQTAAVVASEPNPEKERQEEAIKRESLTAEVEHKVKQQLNQVLHDAQMEMDKLLETQENLKKRNENLRGMLGQMKNKKVEADRAIDELQLKTGELQSIVEELKQQPDEFDIDDSVQGTNAVFNQILNLYAEENAIDDATYFLGEALRREAITLDVFLKVIVFLSY